MAWSGQHRAFVVEEFIKNGGSVITTQRAFRLHFAIGRRDPIPTGPTIRNWVSNFRATSSALKTRPQGRIRTSTSAENVDRVRASIQQSPRRSVRKHAASLGLSFSSVRRILHRDLKLHPYKIQVVQELTVRDLDTRTNLCRDIQQIPRTAVLIFSDEAHFHLAGTVNKQNFRYWAENNPRNLHERPLHSPRVTVWCAIAEFGVWGPYFFEEDGQVVTVTSARYCDMLETFLKPKLEELTQNHDNDNIWFQQDGATAHTSRRSMEILRQMFPGHLISLRGDVGWPPRSPDLTPCDFFLWGYLKEKVYTHRPRTIDELKAAITEEINAIPLNMTRRVMDNFRERLQQCVVNGGRHLQDIIFKTN
jgi:hypothetical protein